MRRKRYSIAISGAHGKTTTTSMISLILENAGFDPTLLVGGNLPEIHGNVKIGRSDYLVTESCEYKDSFLDMRPSVAVILNIAEEHLDYFTGGISQIKSSFEQFASLVPTNGKIIAGWQNQYVRDVLKGLDRNIITFNGAISRVQDTGKKEIITLDYEPEYIDSQYATDLQFFAANIPSKKTTVEVFKNGRFADYRVLKNIPKNAKKMR